MKLFMESNQKNDVRRAIRLFFYSNRHRKSYLLYTSDIYAAKNVGKKRREKKKQVFFFEVLQ